MTATNINVEEFIRVLTVLKNNGHTRMDLDMLPDNDHPEMNKLVIHPAKGTDKSASLKEPDTGEKKDVIKNPIIDRNNNDIFNNRKYFGL